MSCVVTKNDIIYTFFGVGSGHVLFPYRLTERLV